MILSRIKKCKVSGITKDQPYAWEISNPRSLILLAGSSRATYKILDVEHSNLPNHLVCSRWAFAKWSERSKASSDLPSFGWPHMKPTDPLGMIGSTDHETGSTLQASRSQASQSCHSSVADLEVSVNTFLLQAADGQVLAARIWNTRSRILKNCFASYAPVVPEYLSEGSLGSGVRFLHRQDRNWRKRR